METYAISEARKRLGSHLKAAQRDEVPFTLRLRHDPVCVAAPYTWFKRACHDLPQPPDTRRPDITYRQMRLDLTELTEEAVTSGKFIELVRLEGVACVLVPIPWYEEQVKRIGKPAGDTEDT